MPRTRRSNQSKRPVYQNRHRFEHWYRDNQVYFITAKTADAAPVFTTPAACDIFWSNFATATRLGLFTPWVTTLMNNHYHTLGYLKQGDLLPKMMKTLHGTTAKQINDLIQAGELQSPRQPLAHPFIHPQESGGMNSPRQPLIHPQAGGLQSPCPSPETDPLQQTPQRLLPFWGHKGKKTYFDGCIRDERQAIRAFAYTRDQAVRARLVRSWQDYPHTRIHIPLDVALPRATQLNAFLRGVPYKRYQNPR